MGLARKDPANLLTTPLLNKAQALEDTDVPRRWPQPQEEPGRAVKGDTVSSARMGGDEALSQAEREVTEHRLQAGKCQGISTTVTNHLRAVTLPSLTAGMGSCPELSPHSQAPSDSPVFSTDLVLMCFKPRQPA